MSTRTKYVKPDGDLITHSHSNRQAGLDSVIPHIRVESGGLIH